METTNQLQTPTCCDITADVAQKPKKYKPSKSNEKTKAKYSPIETIDDLRKKAARSKDANIGEGFRLLANDLPKKVLERYLSCETENTIITYSKEEFEAFILSYKDPITCTLPYAYRSLLECLAEYGIIQHSTTKTKYRGDKKYKIDAAKSEYDFIVGSKLNEFLAAFSDIKK